MVLGYRVVASSVDALILLFSGPCLVVAFSGDTLVSPRAEQGSSRMVDVVQVGGQVGWSSEVGDKGLPISGRNEGLAQMLN